MDPQPTGSSTTTAQAGRSPESEADPDEGEEDEYGVTRASMALGKEVGDDLFDLDSHLFRRMSTRPPLTHTVISRRKDFVSGTTGIDLRRTVRLWQRLGRPGLLFTPKPRNRKPGRLVVICDVSGSMSDFRNLYLAWTRALVQRFEQVGVFLFATRLIEVTELLKLPDSAVRSQLAELPAIWAGGTNMGAALSEWVDHYGPNWLRSSTAVAIVSDGWDAGDPELLENALRRMKSSCGQLFWINPWQNSPGFSPKTQALRTAVQYVDRMVSGSDADNLMALNQI